MELNAFDNMLSGIDPKILYIIAVVLALMVIFAIIKKAVKVAITVLVLCIVMALSGYRAERLSLLIPEIANRIPTDKIEDAIDNVDNDKIVEAGGKVFEFFSSIGKN